MKGYPVNDDTTNINQGAEEGAEKVIAIDGTQPGVVAALAAAGIPTVQLSPEAQAELSAAMNPPALNDAELVTLRLPTQVADRVGELTEEQIAGVLAEGAIALGVDLAAGPDQTETLFNVERLDIAWRLPVVATEVESEAPYTAEHSITVFKSREGQNMELVLVAPEDAFANDVREDTLVLTNHRGLVLAAQPFINAKEAA